MTPDKSYESGLPAPIQQLLREQREANEKLVLATLHAQELKDQAEGAFHLAEEAQKRAELAQKIAQAIAEDLAKREAELQATAEFREQLLAIVGHDLRNPLNAIAMAAQILELHGALSAVDAKLVQGISHSAQRMGRMIAQLLEFARVRLGGGLELDLQPTDFREVCRYVLEELAMGATVRVHSELQGQLTGTWDPDRLAQVLSNIIGNAIDHATPGTAVVLTAAISDGDLFVEVTNQGVPIPSDILPTIFQPFRQGRHTAQTKMGHLGLGLYIAHQAVAAHGGALTVRSAEGTTTFAIRLPQTPAAGLEPTFH